MERASLRVADPAAPMRPASSTLPRMRVLVVEDDAKMREALRQGLAEQGFVVDVAADGAEGQDLAAVGPYDVVVLDVMLPKRSGLDACRELRRRGVRTPILMLTARAAVEDRVAGLDTGADDYLVKPFAFSELLARLRALTRRPATEPQTVLRAADLELDRARHEVRRAGRPVDLTAKEFALLEYLLRRKGLVVTASMILENVWDFESGGSSNLVAVYINHLRRKVDVREPKLIHTLRGVGYVLRES